MVQILLFDRTGNAPCRKRIARGVSRLPWDTALSATHFELDTAEFALIPEGIDLRGARRGTWQRKPSDPEQVATQPDGAQRGSWQQRIRCSARSSWDCTSTRRRAQAHLPSCLVAS